MGLNKVTSRTAKRLGGLFKTFDFFGQGVGFEVEGAGVKTSFFGAIISLGITIVVLAYAVNRTQIMLKMADTTF